MRQAVSWARAAQDGVWVVSEREPASPQRTPEYDGDLIRNLVRLIVQGENESRAFCTELGVVPYELVYEDFATAAGLSAAVRGVLEHLGVDAPEPLPLRHGTLRQADELNES